MQNQPPTPLHSGPPCASVAPLVARYVGQHPLTHQEAQTLQAHLETCAACRAEVTGYQQLDAVLARHFAPPESDPLSAEEISALLEQIAPSARKAAARPLKTTARRAVSLLPLPAAPPKRRSPALLSALGALAAVVVIAAVGLALFVSRRPSTPGQNTPKLLYALLSNGTLVAMSPSDGNIAWQMPRVYPATTPVAAGETVYVSTDDYQLYALDAKTGAQRWHYQGDNGFQVGAGNGVVVVKLSSGTIVALKASDGSVLWQKPGIGYGGGSLPLVANGVVYVGGDQGVWAFTAQTGDQRWHYPIKDGETSLLLANGAIHTLGWDGIFYSINVGDGSLHWKFPYVGEARNGALATGRSFNIALAAADGRLYLDDEMGATAAGTEASLAAFDLSTGESLWGNVPNGFQGLSAGGGNVYVQVGQTMTAFAGAQGLPLWAAPVAGVNASSLGNGVLYVGSTNGSISALRASDGSIIWQTPLGQVSVYRLFLG